MPIPTTWRSYRDHTFCHITSPYIHHVVDFNLRHCNSLDVYDCVNAVMLSVYTNAFSDPRHYGDWETVIGVWLSSRGMYPKWQWVTLFDPWPTWPISQLTRDPRDPWPATHDYSRVTTPDYCSFQSGPLSGSALKIKHHHCHKIACPWNLVNLIMGQRVTSTDPWPTWPTQICWPTWPVTRWPIVISGMYT